MQGNETVSPYVLPGIPKKDQRMIIKMLPKVTFENLLTLVSEETNISKADILSRIRLNAVCDARHIFCKLARTKTKASLKEIGKYLGRDHTTIISNINSINNLLDTKEEIRQLYWRIEMKIYNREESNKVKKCDATKPIKKLFLFDIPADLPEKEPVKIKHVKGVYSNPQYS